MTQNILDFFRNNENGPTRKAARGEEARAYPSRRSFAAPQDERAISNPFERDSFERSLFNKRQLLSWLMGLYLALSSLSAVNVTIRYPVELGKLSLDDLQCLRIATIQSNDQKVLAQRAELVARAQQLFSIESIMSKLCTQPPDNVII